LPFSVDPFQLLRKIYWQGRLITTPTGRDDAACISLPLEETLDYLYDTKKSFSRFGEGELRLAFSQQSTIYERTHPGLAKRLREIIFENDPQVVMGFNNHHRSNSEIRLVRKLMRSPRLTDSYLSIHHDNDISVFERSILKNELEKYWNFILYNNVNRIFGDASTFNLSLYVEAYKQNRLEVIQSKINRIFNSPSALIIAPKEPQDGLQLINKLRKPEWGIQELETFEIPRSNAYSSLGRVLDYVGGRSERFELVIVQGGATATVLASLIPKHFGIRTLDVGGFTN
jgi:hypothetical protein